MSDKELVKQAARRLSDAAFIRGLGADLEVMRAAAENAKAPVIHFGFNANRDGRYDPANAYWRSIDMDTLRLMIRLALEAGKIRAEQYERMAEADIQTLKGND